MVTIDEYLKGEGITDLSGVRFDELLRQNLTQDEQATFLGMLDEAYKTNVLDCMLHYYDYIQAIGKSKMFESAFYQRTTSQVPKVNQLIAGAGTVLDLGCGEGLKTVYYALQNPNTQFLGVDIRRNALLSAAQRAKRHSLKNLKLVQGDNRKLPFRKEFDYVISDHNMSEGLPQGCYSLVERLLPLVPTLGNGTMITILHSDQPEELASDMYMCSAISGMQVRRVEHIDYEMHRVGRIDVFFVSRAAAKEKK